METPAAVGTTFVAGRARLGMALAACLACSSLTDPEAIPAPTATPSAPSDARASDSRAAEAKAPETDAPGARDPASSASETHSPAASQAGPRESPAQSEQSPPDLAEPSPGGANPEGPIVVPPPADTSPPVACVAAGALASRSLNLTLPGPANTVTLADLDGNGLADIVASHEVSNALSVSLNLGGGRFADPVSSLIESRGTVVSVAAIPAGEHAAVAVLLHTGLTGLLHLDGSGVLMPMGSWYESTEPMLVADGVDVWLDVAAGSRLAAARIDLDTTTDLVVSNENAGIVSVFQNHGMGLMPPASYATTSAPHSVALADLDADGTNDIVSVDAAAGLGVLLNVGDGTFAPVQSYPAGAHPRAVRIGDLNGDARLDIAVANWEGSTGVSLLFNLGDGRFAEPIAPEHVFLAADLELTDVNEDGALDVIAIHGMTTSSVLLNDGTGRFASATPEARSAELVRSALGNIDGDARLDLVVNDNNVDGSVALWLDSTQPDGTAARAPDTYLVGESPYGRLLTADLDGINGADVIVGRTSPRMVSVLLNDGTGKLGTPHWYGANEDDSPRTHGSVAVGDLNGDRAPDLIVANTILFNLGDGSFAEPLVYGEGTDLRAIAAADFDHDGDTDIVRVDQLSGLLTFDVNDGQGGFAVASSSPIGDRPRELALADFNRDQLLDIAVLHEDGFEVLLGKKDGWFERGPSAALGGSYRTMVAADFSGDGLPDVAVGHPEGLSVLINDGKARFSERIDHDFRSFTISTGDLNADGLPDLAGLRPAGVSVLFNWDGRLVPLPQTYATDGESYVIALDDLNRDGAADVILASEGRAEVTVQLSTPCAP